VADTEIGRLGVMMANEGSYPENARALALNGAEVVYRGAYPQPAVGNEMFEIQSRARALDNNFYVVAPNMGTYYLTADDNTAIDTFGGRSFIFDYRGRIVGRNDYGSGSTYMAGVIDIEAPSSLRRAMGQLDEGSAHGAVSTPVPGSHLPQESLSEPRSDEARGVPPRGHRQADRAADRTGHLEEVLLRVIRAASREVPGSVLIFVRVHRTLRMTPAMAARVTDHLRTDTELIDAALESEGGLVESAQGSGWACGQKKMSYRGRFWRRQNGSRHRIAAARLPSHPW
jgi:hypothetical protein